MLKVFLLIAAALPQSEVVDVKVEPVRVSGRPFSPQPAWDAWAPRPGNSFGSSIASGDINADGRDDAIIAAPGNDATYIYLGNTDGLSTKPQTLSHTTGPQQEQRVWFAGDVDGDGFGDILVATRVTVRGPSMSTVTSLLLYRGTKAGAVRGPLQIAQTDSGEPDFPLSVALDDFNKDGFADVVVAYCHDGRLELRPGSKKGLRRPAWSATFPKPEGSVTDWDGSSCTVAPFHATPGARPDIVIRASFCRADDPIQCSHTLAVFPAVDESSYAKEARTIYTTAIPDEAFAVGRDIEGRFDTNADGHGDLILSAPGDESKPERGSIYILSGPILEAPHRFTKLQVFQGSEKGMIAFAVRDLDSDSWPDLVVGASSIQNVPTGYDRLLLIRGTKAGFSPSVTWYVRTPAHRYQRLGESLALGDFNGDKRADLLVGVPGELVSVGAIPGPGYVIPKDHLNFGRALLFLGSDADDSGPPPAIIRAYPRPSCRDLSANDCGF